MDNYPNLMAEFAEAARAAANLKETLSHYSGQQRPLNVDLWTRTMSRYIHAMMHITLCLLAYPDWAAELDAILQPTGCPSQKIPLIEMFLLEKGVVLNEGITFVVA